MFDFTRVTPLARAVVKNNKVLGTAKPRLGTDTIGIYVFIDHVIKHDHMVIYHMTIDHRIVDQS